MRNCWAMDLWEFGQLTESSAKPLLAITNVLPLQSPRHEIKKMCEILHNEINSPLVVIYFIQLHFSTAWLEAWITCLLENYPKIRWKSAKKAEELFI